MANEDTGAFLLVLNAVTPGLGPRSPREIICPSICPHSWYVIFEESFDRSWGIR
jgi:hypothetical protein